MNVDPYRERCSIPDLDLQRLRRVAFCVDVEIAGAAQYVEDETEDPPAPSEQHPSHRKGAHEVEAKKKDQKQRKGEGAALKNPQAVEEEKETNGVIKASGEELKPQADVQTQRNEPSETRQSTKKKEKKRRSEEERKERKERKHQQAIANGSVPAEFKAEASDASSTSNGTETPPSQDRPTTDPLRIYRRCCQLRETPILKRIAEQVASPSACQRATPGILSCLDLSGFWMQIQDLITLGDYLAVVPVRKIMLENCGLTDEGVRVILAGLLATKTPEQARHNRRLNRRANGMEKSATQQLGVVEKLSLKNNPKIGKEGWRHISLFLNMSRSIKAIDLSMIPLPQGSKSPESTKDKPRRHSSTSQANVPTILQEAINSRLAGSKLEELVMAECSLNTDSIGKLVDSVMKCGIARLGLASNNMSREGLEYVVRYVRSGKCEGLDLGGNDLHEHLDMLAEALDEKNPLFALSLADCHLTPSSIDGLLSALLQLPNFRFIDLSHNRDLFQLRPTALKSIRKHIPRYPMLKRLHLMDTAMTPEDAIALAEVLPESHHLAHVNILENHKLAPLASAKSEAEQEEACALYASFMAAVRVSDSLICVDIDVPSPESSDIVKALAKQVVAYSLRNLERLPLSENQDSAIAALAEPHGGEHQLTVPGILLHLVGHVDGVPENHDNDEPAPDDDYIVGGTGVVKALDICLNRAMDGRRSSREISPLQSGTATPQKVLKGTDVSQGKAKEMSKNLLESARKIRARLQPALIKEFKGGDSMNYRKSLRFPFIVRNTDLLDAERLRFLDSTLERMIERFENEYPETRLPKPHYSTFTDSRSTTSDPFTVPESRSTPSEGDAPPFFSPPLSTSITSPDPDIDENLSPPLVRPASTPRRSSSPSLASRQAQQEGRMHRFSQRIKRDILRPETLDYAHGTTGTEVEAEYLKDLRSRLETFEGSEIQAKMDVLGPDKMYEVIGGTAEELAEWEKKDGTAGAGERLEKVREDVLRDFWERKGLSPDWSGGVGEAANKNGVVSNG